MVPLSIWTLTGLKRVITCGQTQAAIQMILSCLQIEDISLWELSIDSASYLMQRANWPKLRHLSLAFDLFSLATEELPAIMISFFHSHVGIECLYLELGNIQPEAVSLPSSCLPKLRSLVIFSPRYDFSLTSFLSAESISRLMHLECPIVDVDIHALPKMDNLRSCRFSSFKNQSLEHLAFLLKKAPKLEKILLATRFLEPSSRPNFDELTHILLQCSNLTHIFFDFLPELFETDDAGLVPKLDNLCRSLSPLRALKYLQFVLKLKYAVMNAKLERDENGNYCGYLLVTQKEAGGDPGYWGDIFLHL